MLNRFKRLLSPEQYRIINLLKEQRLPTTCLENILGIPSNQIAPQLKVLNLEGIINCDKTSPLDMCRIDQKYINENPLFYQLAVKQMSGTPLYQADLNKLNELMTTI